MNQFKRNQILNIFNKNQPDPKTELIFSSAFELLISVILTARSTDIAVNNCTRKLYKVANNPKEIYQLGIDNLKLYIKNLGLFNKKAKYIINLCFILIHQFNGIVPNNRKDLESLPGVGRKTANVVLNTIFNKNVIAIDTHVFRVCNRTKFAIGKNVSIIENKLNRYVRNKFKLHFHNWFVLHGRYICTSRNLKCDICIIKNLCEY